MVVPKFTEFFLPTLKHFEDNEIHTKKEISEMNRVHFNLSEEDIKKTTAKGTKLQYKNRTSWAITHMYKAGLLDRQDRGKYQISTEGKKVLNKNPEFIDRKFLMQYEPYKKYKNSKNVQQPSKDIKIIKNEISSPNDRLEDAYNEIIEELADELKYMLNNMSPKFFEKLVVKLLLNMGYGFNEESGQVTPFTRDGGIDGIIYEDELGLNQIHIQAKLHTNPIGQNDMKNFAYTLEHGIPNGVMITTSSFTKGAIEISEQSSAQIVLIDGEKLTQLMIKHNVGVFEEYNYSIKKIDKDFFEDDE